MAVGRCSGGRCGDCAAAPQRRCRGGAEAELATPRPNLATALTLARAVRGAEAVRRTRTRTRDKVRVRARVGPGLALGLGVGLGVGLGLGLGLAGLGSLLNLRS